MVLARKLVSPPPLDEAWMTVADARIEAGVSLQTIYNWIRSGRLKTESFGGRAVIARSEFRRLLRERADRAPAAPRAAAMLAGAPLPE
jgi:hypothetical protein